MEWAPGTDVSCRDRISADHTANAVNDLSIHQLREGKVTNWKEGGRRDEAMHPVSLESAAGGSLFFREAVLGDEEFETTMRGFISTKQIMQTVATDRAAIGFGTSTAVSGTKLVKIRAGAGTAAVEPSTETCARRVFLCRAICIGLSRALFPRTRAKSAVRYSPRKGSWLWRVLAITR